jgi:hypothetical protein
MKRGLQTGICLLFGGLLLAGSSVVAQEPVVQTASASIGSANASVELYLPKMAALNEEIAFFADDLPVVADELELNFGGNWGWNAIISPLTASAGRAFRVLYDLTPLVSVGVEAEYLDLEHHLSCGFISEGKSLSMSVDLSAPAGGGLAVLALHSSEFVDLGPWSIDLSGAVGYYNMTAKVERQTQVHGIPAFTQRPEIDATTSAAACGAKASLSVINQISDALSLEISGGWRSLLFKRAVVSFNDPEQRIDLDFSGLTVRVGLSLRF